MKSIRWILIVVVILFASSLAADAAEFGFVRIKGKKLSQVRDEAISLQKVIKGWKDGEVLFSKETSSGSVFKTHQILVVFSGDFEAIKNFFETGPYEGDLLKEIKGKFLFNSIRTGQIKGVTAFGLIRKFSNIREVLDLLRGVSAHTLYNKLKNKGSGDLRHATGAGEIYNGTIRPENFLFFIDGDNFVDESKLVAPPGWGANKDHTAQEAKDFIENLDL